MYKQFLRTVLCLMAIVNIRNMQAAENPHRPIIGGPVPALVILQGMCRVLENASKEGTMSPERQTQIALVTALAVIGRLPRSKK
jgi:hypothetical protein